MADVNGLRRPAGRYAAAFGRPALDDAQLEPVMAFDGEPQGLNVPDRPTAEMLSLSRDADYLDQGLRRADGPWRGLDVIGQRQQPARAEHPGHLGHSLAVIGNRALALEYLPDRNPLFSGSHGITPIPRA
jgi:hypothetical protein